MKRLLLSIVLFGSAMFVSAIELNALILHMKSGKQVTCFLKEQPKVSFVENDLIINTDFGETCYQVGDIVKFTYSYVDPNHIDDILASNICFNFDGQSLSAQNLEPSSNVSIFSIDGILLRSAKVADNGEISVDIPLTSGSVIIVKTSELNFKVRKP